MIERYTCPVCSNANWNSIERFTYTRADHLKSNEFAAFLRKLSHLCKILIFAKPRKSIVQCKYLDHYQKRRREVLFNVWFPTADMVELRSIFCETCGFTAYSPRPEEHDVIAKYRYLERIEPDQGGQTGQDEFARMLDYQRALRIHDLTMKKSTKSKLRILDYGGGNGKLLLPYLADNHECYIVDYNDHPLTGIKKIGNNIHDMAGDKVFDIILCSHVLEHVSDISGLLSALRRMLDNEGVLYAEVPLEIWAGINIDADPVTHINFFTLNSFTQLLAINGFTIEQMKNEISNYGKSFMDMLWVLAKKNDSSRREPMIADTKHLLFPSRMYSIRKIFKMFLRPMISGAAYSLYYKVRRSRKNSSLSQ